MDSVLLRDITKYVYYNIPISDFCVDQSIERIIGWYVGQVVKATGGRANPYNVEDILLELITQKE